MEIYRDKETTAKTKYNVSVDGGRHGFMYSNITHTSFQSGDDPVSTLGIELRLSGDDGDSHSIHLGLKRLRLLQTLVDEVFQVIEENCDGL